MTITAYKSKLPTFKKNQLQVKAKSKYIIN